MRYLVIPTLMFGLMGAVAHASDTPVLVELFTSPNCPNCPAMEHTFKEKAAEDPNLLVLMEHVDYWDGKPDPYANADVTQRQYDYSNRLAKRPGRVYTPQPVLDGLTEAAPPLFLSWDGAYKKAASTPKVKLSVSKLKDGRLKVVAPKDAVKDMQEITVFAVEQVEGSKAWRAVGLVTLQATGAETVVSKAEMPKGERYIVTLQPMGPGAVVGLGALGL